MGLACALEWNHVLERDWNQWAAWVPSSTNGPYEMSGELMATGRVADYIRSNWNFLSQNSGVKFNTTDPFDLLKTDPESVNSYMTGLASYSTRYIDLCLTDVPLEASNCTWSCTA